MKKPGLLTAAGLIALGAAGTTQQDSEALPRQAPDPGELKAYQEVVASGSPEAMRRFLAQYPHSRLLGDVFAELVRTIMPQQGVRSAENAIIWRIYAGDQGSSQHDRDQIFFDKRPPVGPAKRTLVIIESASQAFTNDVDRCDVNLPAEVFHDCIADAMEKYATALESPRVVLPEVMQPAPQIIRRAAAKVRAAPTRRAARAAVTEAVREVRQRIALIRAEEPAFRIVAEVQTEQATTIAESLEVAEAKLERAIGL
jgi:hypothetical protein